MRLPLQALIVYLQVFVVFVCAWSKEDHEIFRLHDEVSAAEGPGSTFYTFLDIEPSASHDEIIKAYRKLSRQLHPDKARAAYIANYAAITPSDKDAKNPNATVRPRPSAREIAAFDKQASARFTRLGIIKDILRGSSRVRYDYFLQNGFPAWRGTGYYYARYRPGLGTVLIGLFVLFGGGAHYGAMYMNWKRRREFVQRYIRLARQKAWGNDMGIPGVDVTLGEESVMPGTQAQDEAAGGSGGGGAAAATNRRERRRMEKEGKKEKAKVSRTKAIETLDTAVSGDEKSGPRGMRKRVDAPNGKTLIVDSNGDVYLEEEDDDGEKQLSLLDVNEIPKPKIYDTVLFRWPGWLYTKVKTRVLTNSSTENGDLAIGAEDDREDSPSENLSTKNTSSSRANGTTRKRQSRAR